jgi:predicted adenylyl cyclase CyaB
VSKNIEVKARIPNFDELFQKVVRLADSGPMEILQDDTFFHCEAGRLKLRETPGSSGELIFYRRSDQAEPKESFYLRTPVSDSAALRDLLSLACGQVGRVVKQRTLFHIGRTRVHLDQVEGLGDFLELEVALTAGETSESGVREAQRLMDLLGVEPYQLVEGAYVDLQVHQDDQPQGKLR